MMVYETPAAPEWEKSMIFLPWLLSYAARTPNRPPALVSLPTVAFTISDPMMQVEEPRLVLFLMCYFQEERVVHG